LLSFFYPEENWEIPLRYEFSKVDASDISKINLFNVGEDLPLNFRVNIYTGNGGLKITVIL
jgi:hypothetical protein